MPCMYPSVVPNPRFDKSRPISPINFPMMSVSCGHCYFCRMRKVNDISLMVSHEYQTVNQKACFLTLTFQDCFLPKTYDTSFGSCYEFDKSYVQKFIKRVRSAISREHKDLRFKYFACGEFGHLRGRCHNHLILLGVSAAEIEPYVISKWKDYIPVSKAEYQVLLENDEVDPSVRGIGIYDLQDCDPDSSYYCTKYQTKDETAVWWSPDSPKYEFDALLKSYRMQRNCLSNEVREYEVNNVYYVKSKSPWVKTVPESSLLKHDDGSLWYNTNSCCYCPFLDWSKQLVLNMRRQVKKLYENANRVSFSWRSGGLGKEYCLAHKNQFIKKESCFLKVADDGHAIYIPIPRSYKKYIMDEYHRSFENVDFARCFDNWSDLYPSKSTFLERFASVVKNDSYISYCSDCNSNGFSYNFLDVCSLHDVRSLKEVFSHLVEFNQWSAHRLFEKRMSSRQYSDARKEPSPF